MSHADRPFTRPLAGVDQALSEGRARQPVELLDQLRERLDRLDQNHPSASPRSTDRHEARSEDAAPDHDTAADPATGEAATEGESARISRADRSSPNEEGADGPPDDQPGDQGAGQPAVARQAERPEAAADGVAGGVADDGHYGVIKSGLTAKGEPYRPWFADGADTPWFVDPWFAE